MTKGLVRTAAAALVMSSSLVACTSLGGGDTYRVTFDFTGLGEDDVMPAWRAMQRGAAEECLGDDSLERVEFVFENMPDHVMSSFDRESAASCDEVEQWALSDP